MSSNHSVPLEKAPPFYVSGVSVSLARDAGRTISSIELSTKKNRLLKGVQKTMYAGDAHMEAFDPHIFIDADDHMLVSINCSSKLWRRTDTVVVEFNLHDTACLSDQGIQWYRKTERKIDVAIACQQSFYQLYSPCRLLVIGDTGAGKSSLIHKAFGIEEVHVSQNTRGSANIDREFCSPTNNRFIVHDSLGFEAGDEQNVELVKDFVTKRKAIPRGKDQLHAVWLCIEIPYAGGRLLEAGTEYFLRRRDEILGKVPLIVVLTKVDQLDLQLQIELSGGETLEESKSRYMKKYVVDPLHKAAGKDITYVAVSKKDDYSESLFGLLTTTDDAAQKYSDEEALLARLSAKQKIDASISH